MYGSVFMKVRKIRWVRHVADMGELRNAYRISVRKLEGKGPFRHSTRKWKGNIKMNLTETGSMSLNWIYLVLYRGQCELF
jgi:hypothetical protein